MLRVSQHSQLQNLHKGYSSVGTNFGLTTSIDVALTTAYDRLLRRWYYPNNTGEVQGSGASESTCTEMDTDCSGLFRYMFHYCTSQQRCCLTAHTSQRPVVASEWHDLLHIGWVWAKLGVAGYSNLLHYENLWDGWVRDGNSRLLAWQRLLSRSFHWFSTQRQWNWWSELL